MPRKLLSQPVEKGVTEAWAYKTDVLQGVTGNEQRIALLDYPTETLSLSIGWGDDGQQVFDGESEISGQEAIVRSLNDLIACGGEVEVPLWHLSDNITSASWTTGTQIADLTLPAGTPFFVAIGEDVLVKTGSVWRRAEVTAYSQSFGTITVDFGGNTGAAAGDLGRLAPLRTGLVTNLASLVLGRASATATASLSVLLDRRQGRSGMSGGVGLNTSTPDGAPVISLRGIRDDFDLQIDHGLEKIAGPTGFPYYVTNWTEAKFTGKFRDSFRRRQGDRPRYWRTLFTALRGSQGNFWLPTRRGEFRILASDGGLGIITIEGRQFFDLWSTTNLKALCLDDLDVALTVRQVTSCELSGDDTVLGFAEGWATEPLQLSIALPCRLDRDTITWTYDSGTTLEFSFTSVPYTYPVDAEPIDWEGLLAQIDGSSVHAEFDVGRRYAEVPIAGELGGTATALFTGKGPEQTPVNGRRAMAFEDAPFDPTLGGTLDVHVWADTKLAQFRIGAVPADLQIEGQGEVPRIFILPGGDPEIPAKLLGEARYIRSWEDPAVAIGPSRATAPVRYEDGYRLEFADTTYFAPDWVPNAVAMNDRSGNANHIAYDPPINAFRGEAEERYAFALTATDTPGNPFARPDFEVIYENIGIVSNEGDPADYERWRESDNLGGSSSAWDLGNPLLDATIAAWRNGRRAVTHNERADGDPGTIILSAVTERTWLFALRIPPDAGAFAGVGPTSTANPTGKNFPLYFKSSTVIGSQPSASNRDSALDMSPYYGLDAIISVRQAVAGIRISMRIEGVSGRVITTASGEATTTGQNGWSAGGWYGGGGDYPYPLALMGVVSGALSDADQDEGVDWAAWEYDLITP